jgi:hypothetical protein
VRADAPRNNVHNTTQWVKGQGSDRKEFGIGKLTLLKDFSRCFLFIPSFVLKKRKTNPQHDWDTQKLIIQTQKLVGKIGWGDSRFLDTPEGGTPPLPGPLQ